MNREMSVLQNRLATQIFANHKFAILRLSIEPVAQTVPAGDCIISCSSRKSDVNYMQKEFKLNKRQCAFLFLTLDHQQMVVSSNTHLLTQIGRWTHK